MSKQVLKLKGVLLDHLPENYSFDGTLDLEGSSIKELPKGLFVSGDLILGDKITVIPPEAIIGGNVYWTQTLVPAEGKICATALSYEESSIVAGKIYVSNGVETVSFVKSSNKENYIVLDDGEVFWYKRKYHYTHQARDHEFDRTPFDLFFGYNDDFLALQWTTPQGTFAKRCKDKAEARFLVNYQDAIERGLEQYRGLDIDTPMLGHDILAIYQICTHSCMKVVQEYLDTFHINLDNQYTLRQIGYTVQRFKEIRYAPASEVFMAFFNIPYYGDN